MLADLSATKEEAGHKKNTHLCVCHLLIPQCHYIYFIKSKIVIVLFPSSLAKLFLPHLLLEHQKTPSMRSNVLYLGYVQK